MRTSSELATVLQRRMQFTARWALVVFGLFVALIVGGYWRLIVARPAGLFTDPPLLGWLALANAAFAIVLRETSAARRPTLDQLRRLEWLLFGPGCLWTAAMWARALWQMAPRLADGAVIVASAAAGFWVIAMFAYAVLIPNHWRRSITVLACFAILATVPEGVVLVLADVAGRTTVLYVVTKVIWLGGAMALATYGAHRIEMLTLDAQQARALGPYELRELIGSGGMGEVHRAEHRLLRRPCAVKLIRPGLDVDPEVLARFEREVQATAGLTHPNTVQVYDYGRADDGTFYYVMEYLGGESLEQAVARDGPMEATRAVRLLAQVCGSLAEAHAAGLIHRDIKPSNVIVCERGGLRDVAKVLDFGLVASVRREEGEADPRITQAGLILGTPAYMSPEQVSGEPLGAASDLYSIGALAYFLLTGRAVFEGRGPVQLLVAHVTEAPAPVRTLRTEVPAALDRVVLQCLAKRPADRPTSALVLQSMLLAALHEEHPGAPDAPSVGATAD